MISLLFILTLFAQAPMKQNRAPVQAQPAPLQQPSSAEVDRLFALAATQGSNAEIDMAELALKRGSADEVKAYAAKMIAEHKGLMDELMPVLQRVLPNGPAERLAPADQLALRHLESVKPVDFDQLYVMQQIGGHLATLTAFHTEADNRDRCPPERNRSEMDAYHSSASRTRRRYDEAYRGSKSF